MEWMATWYRQTELVHDYSLTTKAQWAEHQVCGSSNTEPSQRLQFEIILAYLSIATPGTRTSPILSKADGAGRFPCSPVKQKMYYVDEGLQWNEWIEHFVLSLNAKSLLYHNQINTAQFVITSFHSILVPSK